MKRWFVMGLCWGVVATLAHAEGQGWEFNLAKSATVKGLLPNVAPLQGTTNGWSDSSENDWGGPSFVEYYRSTATNILQPYLVWTNTQQVRSVRIWNDLSGYGVYTWDQVMVDTLIGPPSGAATEGNWVNRYTSATGLNTRFVDVDLGATYATYGVRVRVMCLAGNNDVNIGEIGVYGPRQSGGPTLTGSRSTADGTAVSSEIYRFKAAAVDGVFSSMGWLSDVAANNSGSDFYYEMIFNNPGKSVGSVALIWNVQGGFCSIPSAWELQIIQGTVTNSLGTFQRKTDPNGTVNLQYHYDFGRVFTGVTKVRLVAPEANVAGGLGVGLTEIEAFANTANPSTVTEFNIARLATRKSSLPFVAPTQGDTNGLCDGRLNDGWMVNPAFENNNGYIVFTAGVTNIQPYLAWDTAQLVRSLRLWNDNLSGYGRACPWDRIMVDTLTGPPSGADTEGNWVNQYDSGTGLNTYYQDVDLGNAVKTCGVRVRAFRTAADVNVAEIGVYGPRFVGVPPQRLIDSRNSPDGTAVSSTVARNASLATNMDYNTAGWLSDTAVNNAGSEYTYELIYNSPGRPVGGLSLIWNFQSPLCDVPSTWELQLVQGAVTNSLGPFSREEGRPGAYRLSYHYDFAQVWTNVTKVRLVVPEVNVAGGAGIGLTEFETYSNRQGYLSGTFFYLK